MTARTGWLRVPPKAGSVFLTAAAVEPLIMASLAAASSAWGRSDEGSQRSLCQVAALGNTFLTGRSVSVDGWHR
jgi:hypothetical protein